MIEYALYICVAGMMTGDCTLKQLPMETMEECQSQEQQYYKAYGRERMTFSSCGALTGPVTMTICTNDIFRECSKPKQVPFKTKQECNDARLNIVRNYNRMYGGQKRFKSVTCPR